MKNGLKLFILLLAYGSVSLAASHVVIMKSISFSPRQLEIKSGDSVEWDNQSYTEHSATSNDSPPVFDSGKIKPKDRSKKINFTKPGKYTYRCTVHGRTMSGEIVVVQ